MVKHDNKHQQGRQILALVECGLEVNSPHQERRNYQRFLQQCGTLRIADITYDELANVFRSIIRCLNRVIRHGGRQELDAECDDAYLLASQLLLIHNPYFTQFKNLLGITLRLLETDSLRCLCWWLFIRLILEKVSNLYMHAENFLQPNLEDISNAFERRVGEESYNRLCRFVFYYLYTIPQPAMTAIAPFIIASLESLTGASRGRHENILVEMVREGDAYS